MEILKNSLDQPNQAIDVNNYEHPISTLAKNFHKPTVEVSTYVRFVYGPLNIFNYTWGQVLGSMSADSINILHTSQQSTKEVLKEELEGYFRSIPLKLEVKILDE